jgi:hypothetical protein
MENERAINIQLFSEHFSSTYKNTTITVLYDSVTTSVSVVPVNENRGQ